MVSLSGKLSEQSGLVKQHGRDHDIADIDASEDKKKEAMAKGDTRACRYAWFKLYTKCAVQRKCQRQSARC
jgi:hypothetical protein